MDFTGETFGLVTWSQCNVRQLLSGIFIKFDKLAKGLWKDSVFGSTEWIDR